MKFKIKSNYQHKDTYGKVFKVSSVYIGLLLDLLIPFTFGLITLFFTKKFNKEILRISLNEV